MTHSQSIAYRLRWLLLILAVVCVGGAIGWLYFGQGFYRFWPCTLYLGIFLASQWFFLNPRPGWTVKVTAKGRPMILSMVCAALVSAAISAGLIATLLELPDWWDSLGDYLRFDGLLAVLGGLWAVWSVIFFIYWRQADHYTRLGRMVRALLVGSFLQSLVSTGVLALVPDKHDCTCARGSFWGVVLGTTALLWTFGPGVALLFLREKYRREKLLRKCTQCGYDLRGTLAAGRTSCPECGTATGTGT